MTLDKGDGDEPLVLVKSSEVDTAEYCVDGFLCGMGEEMFEGNRLTRKEASNSTLTFSDDRKTLRQCGVGEIEDNLKSLEIILLRPPIMNNLLGSVPDCLPCSGSQVSVCVTDRLFYSSSFSGSSLV